MRFLYLCSEAETNSKWKSQSLKCFLFLSIQKLFSLFKMFFSTQFFSLTLSPPNTECSRSLCSRCYTLGGASTHLLNESRNSQTGSCRNSDLIWKHMHIKNNAIINTNRIWMKTVWCSRVKCGSRKDCEALGELMEDIYCSFALIILLNMIQM